MGQTSAHEARERQATGEDARLVDALARFGIVVALPLDDRRRAEYRTMLARRRRARARRLAYMRAVILLSSW